MTLPKRRPVGRPLDSDESAVRTADTLDFRGMTALNSPHMIDRILRHTTPSFTRVLWLLQRYGWTAAELKLVAEIRRTTR